MEKKLINLELHPKEYQLIQFFRDQLKFGTVEIVVHAGIPEKYRVVEGRFDGNVKQLDNDF